MVDAGAELSQETILGLASFVPDVQAELKRVNKETQKQIGIFDSDGEEVINNKKDETGKELNELPRILDQTGKRMAKATN